MTEKIGLYKCKSGTETKCRVRWFGRYDPHAGKEKRYSKTFSRKADAEAFRRQKEAEFNGGAQRDPSGATLKEYAERWLEYRIGFGGIKPATALAYRETFVRLYDHFGPSRLVRTINQKEARDFLAGLRPRQAGRTEPLSAWAKHRILRECNCLFASATADGIVPKNPFRGIARPKLPQTEWFYLRPDKFREILSVTPTLRERVLYALCYTAGLRRNEALSLYWTNIDFEKGEIHIVNRPASEKYPPFHIKDTEARTIPLPKFTVDMLSELQMEAAENVPFVVLDHRRSDHIQAKWKQCRERGQDWLNRYWSNNTLTRFQRRTRRAGIDTKGLPLTLHDLRKSGIQNWANVLPMNVVKELAGHSSIETTARFYSTVTDEHRAAAQQHGQDLLTLTDHKLTISANSEE